MAQLNITVPIDLGELGDFDSDVVFSYEEDETGIHVTIQEILVNGFNMLSLGCPESLLRDINDYIICNFHPSEEPLQ